MLPCDTYIVKKSQVQRWQIKFETDHVSWESSQEDGKGNAAIARKSTNHRWSPNGRYLLLPVCFDSGSHFGRRYLRDPLFSPFANLRRLHELYTADFSAIISFRRKKCMRQVAVCNDRRVRNVGKKCFRSVPVLKILGPIHDFVVKSETNTKWLDKKFHSVRTSGDQMDFRVNIHKIIKAHDMLTQRNVTIDRTSHEDRQETKKIRCKWLPVGDKESESLPLIEFQNLSSSLFGARKRVAHVQVSLNCRQAREKPGKRSRRRSTFVLEMSEWTGDVSHGSVTPFSQHSCGTRTLENELSSVSCSQDVHQYTHGHIRRIFLENLLQGGGLRCTEWYLRGSKAAQSSMIPSHMFTEHQRSEMRAAGGLSGISASTRSQESLEKTLITEKKSIRRDSAVGPQSASSADDRTWTIALCGWPRLVEANIKAQFHN
ncbi:hypothetical protein ALC57_10756 [Trachymyrmex cornetzi]|uniref:Uncharacterized protein n=1 Tax=Trachymyrmex cornetzi TaxID=471704 RepID=A0A151J3J0_9HYME|nr:hypothetical protein ALC57_10756 [Trachymyrmex cornetzi]